VLNSEFNFHLHQPYEMYLFHFSHNCFLFLLALQYKLFVLFPYLIFFPAIFSVIDFKTREGSFLTMKSEEMSKVGLLIKALCVLCAFCL